MLLSALIYHPAQAKPILASDTEIATAGNFTLSWNIASSANYQLQQANNPAFSNAKLLYQGRDNASVMSGLTNGDYYYRVRAVGDPWSDTVEVKVRHHSLSDAMLFFSLGAIMFAILIIVLYQGSNKQDEQ